MKIRIPAQTVEIDPEQWAIAYGISQSAVRDDVRAYFDGWFQQQVEQLGLEAKVRPCAQCGKKFSAARSDALYCSGACKVKAHRAKKT